MLSLRSPIPLNDIEVISVYVDGSMMRRVRALPAFHNSKCYGFTQ